MNNHNIVDYLNNLYRSNYIPDKNKNNNLIELLEKDYPEIYNKNFSSLNKFNKFLNTYILNIKYKNDYYNTIDRDSIINKDNITNELLIDIYEYIRGNTNIIYKYNKTKLYSKPKKQNPKEPSDYRYLTDHHDFIKIIDRIFIYFNKILVDKQYIDTDIFIVKILDIDIKNFSYYADINTQSKNRVLCLDFSNAFDNVEWYRLYDHMINFYKKSMSFVLAEALTNFYFPILQNRIFYFYSYDYKIEVKKGISQGFPSSNLIFTIFMIQIIDEWMHKINLKIKDYLDMNIYIDDIFIRFKKYDKKNNYILNKLIKEFELNDIKINNKKCFGDKKLNLNFKYRQIKDNDFYLGIPFTRNNKYFDYIMNNFREKYEIKKIYMKEYNKYNIEYSWNNFIDIIKNNKEEIKIITGFLRYKLKPLTKNKMTNIEILSIIHNNYKFSIYQLFMKKIIKFIFELKFRNYLLFFNIYYNYKFFILLYL